MSVQSVKEYLRPLGLAEQVIEFTVSSATVAEAAAALGCEPARIAKTMSFLTREGPVLIVAAGDEKVDNHKFKETFHEKAKMIPASEVETLTGHPPGGMGRRLQRGRINRRIQRRIPWKNTEISRGWINRSPGLSTAAPG